MNRITGAAALLAVLSFSPAFAIDISECGQSVPRGEDGVLVADLVCPAATAVRLSNSSLDLAGHSITAEDGWGVWCWGSCSVAGGSIHGAQSGIYLQRGARLVATDVTITDSTVGIEAEDWNNGSTGAKALLSNVVVTGSEGAAVLVGRVKAANVTLTGNPGSGIAGPASGALKARGLTITNNASSEGCNTYGCEGIDIGRVSGRELVVTGNLGIGIKAVEARLRGATVTGNVRAGSTRDLVIAEEPDVRDVECDISTGWGDSSDVHWGVCALDDADL